MRLGLNLGYWGVGDFDPRPLALEAERLGFHSVWIGEANTFDALTTLSWIAARTQHLMLGTAVLGMPARTPTATGMSAAGLDFISGGRMILGLGVSSPRLSEGWHGIAFRDPVEWSRQYVQIVRRVIARKLVASEGDIYTIPYKGSGRSHPKMKLLSRPQRRAIPIYLGALGPRNVRLAAEIADGLLPVFYSPQCAEFFHSALSQGFAAAGRDPADFDLAVTVPVIVGDDLHSCFDQVKPHFAFMVGAMGTAEENYYKRAVSRMGYEEVANEVAELFRKGLAWEAAAAIPDRFVDEFALCGPPARIRERLALWKESGVTTILVGSSEVRVLRTLAEHLL